MPIALVRELPVVAWLMHGVHGNEISSADAALAEAYHLLASQGDAGVDAVLRDALVLIDPMQNPDGRARFICQNLQGARGRRPIRTPYVGRARRAVAGRPHQSLPVRHEPRLVRAVAARDARPHQDRRSSICRRSPSTCTSRAATTTYYFAPPAEAINPHMTQEPDRRAGTCSAAPTPRDSTSAAWPTSCARSTTRSIPGYGDSWPTFQGSIGMTYEQASARGLSFARTDGDTLTYRDGVMHHFNAAIVTAITAARNRERLHARLPRVSPQRRRRRRERARSANTCSSPARTRRARELLARNLATQGIEVRRADEPIKVGARTIPAGAYLVSNAQPTARLLRNLLDPQDRAVGGRSSRSRKSAARCA